MTRQGRGDYYLMLLSAWWRAGSVKGAAEEIGIVEQTAKNELLILRQRVGCTTNDDLVRYYLRELIGKRHGYLTSNEKRKLRYDYDAQYRDRVKRQARNAMRRKREVDRSKIVTEYDRLLAIQGNRCAICGNPERLLSYGNPRRLAVDHDHVTGVIRELLCGGCNYMIGCAHDSPEILEAGAAYLRKHRSGTSHNSESTDAEHDQHAA